MGTTDLTNRAVPLDMTPEEFRKVGHRLVDDIAAFLASLPRRPVAPDETPREVRSLLPSDLPETGADAASLLAEAAPLVFDHSAFNGHPRFFGYITSSAAPIGSLADLLAAAANPNVGAWPLSPAASEIEGQCVRWIDGAFALRACIVNFRTALADLEGVPGIVVRAGAEVDRALRPGRLASP